MAKFTPALLVLLLLTNMCCCGNSRAAQLSHEVREENTAYSEMVDSIFEALDNNDKEGLKQLFSVTTIKNTPDLDAQIDELFRFYQGPRESFEDYYHIHSASHNEYGTQSKFLDCYFEISAGGEHYHIYMSMDSRNDFVPDDEGMHIFDIATDQAANGQYFAAHRELSGFPHGIYIQTSPEKADDITWIMNKPMYYQYFDRELNGEDLATFVQENGDSYAELSSYFGESNASYTGSYFGEYYYELNDGNFAHVDVNNGRIKFICIANEEKRIGTLYSNPDEDLWN